MSWKEKYELKLMWPFYLEMFFQEILFLYPMFNILYFQDLGFSLTQIGFLIGIQSFAVILFEIPTGAIADIFGRKISVILGFLLVGINFIVMGFVNNYYLLCLLFFLWGLFSTFISGAIGAWFVDLMKQNNCGKKVHDAGSFQVALGSLGIVISGILGAFLAKMFGLGIIWSFSGIAFLSTALILTFAKEDFVKQKINLEKYYITIFNQIRNSGKEVYNNNTIFFLIFAGMFCVIAMVFSGDLAFFPLIKDAGFPVHYFGYLISISYSIGMLLPFASKSLINKFGGAKKYLIGMLILLILVTIPIIFVNNLYGYLAIYIIGTAIFMFYGPIRYSFFQSHLPSKKRATIDSIRSMVYSIAAVIAMPLVGYIADTFGPKIAIFIGGLLFIPAIIMYMKVKGEGKKHL